jgi:hypothetical protein
MMIKLWTRRSEMADEDKKDVEDISGYENSGVELT